MPPVSQKNAPLLGAAEDLIGAGDLLAQQVADEAEKQRKLAMGGAGAASGYSPAALDLISRAGSF